MVWMVNNLNFKIFLQGCLQLFPSHYPLTTDGLSGPFFVSFLEWPVHIQSAISSHYLFFPFWDRQNNLAGWVIFLKNSSFYSITDWSQSEIWSLIIIKSSVQCVTLYAVPNWSCWHYWSSKANQPMKFPHTQNNFVFRWLINTFIIYSKLIIC